MSYFPNGHRLLVSHFPLFVTFLLISAIGMCFAHVSGNINSLNLTQEFIY